MKKDALSFVNELKLNTGIDISLFSIVDKADEGKFPKTAITEFCYDDFSKRAYFPIKYKNSLYVASITGELAQAKTYAFLIGELARVPNESQVTEEQFKLAILSSETDSSFIKKQAKRFAVLETSRFVMVVDSNGKNLSDVSDFLSNYLENNDFFVVTDDQRHVVIKTCDQAIGDYSSCAEYAEYLTLSAFEETGLRLKIGVGGIVDALDKVHVSYSQAISTLDMMDVLQAEGDVHTYKEYVLIKILGDMPKTKLNQYLNLLLDESSKDVLSDEEIISTAEAFLNNNLNASETSRKMYLHRNTLSYRLDKIEKATGLNIRSFSDAVTFRLITILSKLTR